MVVVVEEVVVEVDVVVDDEVVVGAGTEVVLEIFLMPLLVGERKLKTKAPTMPRPAMMARTLRRSDHLVSDDVSSGGGGGGSADGGGP
jgi:hypothetical protein